MLPLFRKVAVLEGSSFLLLLFIAMPLKYMAGIPEAVRYTGMIHGLLFIAYIALAFSLSDKLNWKPKVTFHALLAGILPFGTFWFDRKYLRSSV